MPERIGVNEFRAYFPPKPEDCCPPLDCWPYDDESSFELLRMRNISKLLVSLSSP